MRRGTKVLAGAGLVVTIVFLLTPVFRQAFEISMTQWNEMFRLESNGTNLQPGWFIQPPLEALAREVEKNGDAQGMAFVAVRLHDPSKSARLAEAAVRLDPSLTWVYGVVAVRLPSTPEIDGWVPKLEQWDPQNALPHFIRAETIDIRRVTELSNLPWKEIEKKWDEGPAWRSAMAAAFASSMLDDYFDRLRELDRKVVVRYHFNDPYDVTVGEEGSWRVPTNTSFDSYRYGKSLLEAGQQLESKADLEGARKEYLAVARFSQVIATQREVKWVSATSPKGAYQRLAVLYRREGKGNEAAFFDLLEAMPRPVIRQYNYVVQADDVTGDPTHWNAVVVRVSGLALAFSTGLLVICLLNAIGKRREIMTSPSRTEHLFSALAPVGAACLSVSSATLYVSYRPYAEIFRRFIDTGDSSHLSDLCLFLEEAREPLGVTGYFGMRTYVYHFWIAIVVPGIAGLLLVALKHLLRFPRTLPQASGR